MFIFNLQYELDIPIEVKVGTIGRISLSIPWTGLYTQPVILTLEVSEFTLLNLILNCIILHYEASILVMNNNFVNDGNLSIGTRIYSNPFTVTEVFKITL